MKYITLPSRLNLSAMIIDKGKLGDSGDDDEHNDAGLMEIVDIFPTQNEFFFKIKAFGRV